MTHFCKDCKHMRINDSGTAVCDSPKNFPMSVDEAEYLVTGIDQPTVRAMRGATCKALRTNRDPEMLKVTCGPDGKWFESKET